MQYEEHYINEIIHNPVEEISDIAVKQKFLIEDLRADYLLISKVTLRGYAVSIKFERIKGTNLFRMSSTSKGVEKTFDKLYKTLKSTK